MAISLGATKTGAVTFDNSLKFYKAPLSIIDGG
jgi:hypothetical protein